LTAAGATGASGSREGLEFVDHAVEGRGSHGVTHFSVSGVSLTLLTRQVQQLGGSSKGSAKAAGGEGVPNFFFGSSGSDVRRRKRRHVGNWAPGSVGGASRGGTAVNVQNVNGSEASSAPGVTGNGSHGEAWDEEHALLRQWFGDITLSISKGDVTLPADWVLNKMQKGPQQGQGKRNGWFKWGQGQQQQHQQRQAQRQAQQSDQQWQDGAKPEQRAPAISLVISLPGSAVATVSAPGVLDFFTLLCDGCTYHVRALAISIIEHSCAGGKVHSVTDKQCSWFLL
jgi:hypothetical protein